jgi:exodeoxyribonuclease III
MRAPWCVPAGPGRRQPLRPRTPSPTVLKLITWNCNSIRQRLPRLLGLLERHRPDVVCLQETKVVDADFPRGPLEAAGYTVAVHGQKTYNGVAILSKRPMEDIEAGFAEDPLLDHARVLSATIDGVRVYDLYVPNGKAPGTEPYEVKLQWYRALRAHLAARHTPDDPVLLLGDFNVAPEPRDVHDPKRWEGKIHFSGPERSALQDLMSWGFVDLLRLHTEDTGIHTWWDYRLNAFPRGWGLRIDLALGTSSVAKRCLGVTVDKAERQPGGDVKPSDHAPVVVELA